jgi:uncharacterized protein (DUF1015 family)
MAKIHPFKAVRPTRDKAQVVSTRPLAAYRKHVLRAKLDENPFTFLHIIHPEGDNLLPTKSNWDERMEATRNRFTQFEKEGILVQDEHPAFYIYRQTKNGHVYTGLIAGASVDEYNSNTIKKHEATITSRETMFTNYVNAAGFNAEPVLLAHEHSQAIDAFLAEQMTGRPEYEFSTTDRIKHELWCIPSEKNEEVIALYGPIKNLYIADGHHRSASSSSLNAMKRKSGDFIPENYNYFLSYLIDEQKLEIIEFNRLIKHLNGMTNEAFLLQLSAYFEVSELTTLRKPNKAHELICILGKNCYSIQIPAKLIQTSDPVKKLDAQLLTDYILEPLLNIQDLKTSKEIDFVPGTIPLDQLYEQIQDQEYAAAFILFPVQMSEVKAVADAGKIMPPKSTWMEPKLRSGLTIYRLNE